MRCRWYYDQTESMRNAVKNLVRNGQLEFISGGWCMHDEAAANYVGKLQAFVVYTMRDVLWQDVETGVRK